MPAPSPAPKAAKPPRNADGKPSFWEKLIERKFLFAAILIHVFLALGATYVVITDTQVTRKKFLPPGGGADAAKKGAEHKVSLGRKQSTMSAPEQAKRVVTNSAFAKVALPEMPELPSASSEVFANRAIGLGGAGNAFGATGSPGGGGDGTGSGINFFGLRTRAKSLVLLVDVSDSMITPLNRTAASAPVPGAPAPIVPASTSLKKSEKGPQTYLQLEREIARVIRSLDRNSTFSVVVFAGDVEPYKETLVPANDAEKEKAIRWLATRNPGLNLLADKKAAERSAAGFATTKTGASSVTKFNHSGTRTMAALDYAFKMNPDGICLVSDGVPTDGGYQALEILPKVKERQQALPKPAAIHVVAFLADSGLQFMKDLAAQNQGTFKEIKPSMTTTGF